MSGSAMLKMLGAGLLAGLVATGPAWAATAVPPPNGNAQAAAPRLVMPERSVDFGEVLDTQVWTVQLPFTNKGDAPLNIAGAKGSCTCVGGRYAKKTYAPGEQGELTVFFNPSRRRGLEKKVVTFYTDDPAQPEIEIPVSVRVRPVVFINPGLVKFDGMTPQQPSEYRVTITGRERDFAVTGVRMISGPAEVVSWEIGETRFVRSDGEDLPMVPLMLKIDPQGMSGTFRGQLEITTSDERRPRMKVHFSGDIDGDLALDLNAFAFKQVKSGQPRTVKGVLRSESGTEFRVLEVRAEGKHADFVTATAKPVGGPAGVESSIYEIHATLNPEVTRRDILHGDLVIVTDLNGGEFRRVQFSAVASP